MPDVPPVTMQTRSLNLAAPATSASTPCSVGDERRVGAGARGARSIGRVTTATLLLRALAPDGRVVPARFYALDAAGAEVSPETLHLPFRNDRHWATERHFIASGVVELRLPPGRASIRVERGTEFVPQSVQVELEAGDFRRVDVVVPPWIDMNARGWYSGDIHVHREPSDMTALLLAEGLNAGTCITTQWRDDVVRRAAPVSEATDGWLVEIDETHAFSQLDAEVERLGKGPGALVAVGLREPVTFECDRWYPSDTEFAVRAHARGGHVDAEKPVWDAVPVVAALRELDSVNVVCNHFARLGTDLDLATWGARLPPEGQIETSAAFARWVSTLYYRLLNCGFRLPVSGGTGSSVIPNPVGYNRTYVRVDGPFSYPAWLSGLAAGRSFATNGPMLALTADGFAPGDEIAASRPRRLWVRAHAESLVPLDRLELVHNGDVIAEATEPGGAEIVLDHELAPTASGWIAARAFAGDEPNVRFAHTSPIHLSPEVAPARRAEAAVDLRDWVMRTLGRATAAVVDAPPDRQGQALDPLREAVAVYERLVASPEPD
jgi:hypothetical protein